MISAVLSNRPLIAISFLGSEWHSQDIHPQHPPNKEDRDDGARDVYYPIASCFGFAKIEHLRMVAGQRYCREIPMEFKPPSLRGLAWPDVNRPEVLRQTPTFQP